MTRGSNFTPKQDLTPDITKRGYDFRTAFKVYDDCSRVNRSIRENPILGVGASIFQAKES